MKGCEKCDGNRDLEASKPGCSIFVAGMCIQSRSSSQIMQQLSGRVSDNFHLEI